MIHFPFAYVGPGAGFAFLGSFFSILLSLLAGIASLLLWPFRAIVRLLRGSRTRARVILLGVEGFAPDRAEQLMAEGKLPHLAKLRTEGSYRKLRAATPGGWATPGFWKILDQHAVDSTVLLVPGNFPAAGFRGRRLWRSDAGELASQPHYYAKYLVRLLGASSGSTEALFFSALDHQKRGLLACTIRSVEEELDRMAGRLFPYTGKYTTLFVCSDQGTILSNRELDANVQAIEDVAPAILRIFGFA